jgi:hypothetical protein
MRGVRGVGHPHDFQLNTRWKHLEQSQAVAKKYRDLMYLHLI